MGRDLSDVRFKSGDTAEDFANLVADGLSEAGEGVVRIPFEDYTIPDRLVFGEMTEINGVEIRYFELFSGALEHLHGIKIAAFRAVPNPEVPAMSPFCMSQEVVVEPPQTP